MNTGDPPDTNESATSRFRRLWEAGATPPDVFGFLASMGEHEAAERVEVVRIDQWRRWRIGQPLSPKSYLRALPDVALHPEFVRLLIDGDRRGRQFSLETEPSAGRLDRASPDTSDERGGGPRPAQSEEPTLPESAEHQPPTVAESGGAPPDASGSPVSPTPAPGSTQSGECTERAGSVGSFTLHLHDRPPQPADVESLQSRLDATRFTVVRRIGVGGMGVVFEVYDHDRGEVVALKTMRKADPETLGRFKQEFRSLADIVHVNLASLFQLFAIDDRWFFTMELIEGSDFLAHVRGADPPAGRPEAAGTEAAGDRSGRRFCEHRLRAALIQLVEGVHYLHGRGKLHRDLKPTNVLITDDGRLVVLDFGLAADLTSLAREGAADRQIVGTAAHMSPEQAAGREASPASDWYSVGVMIFQALTGRLPFDGNVESVMRDKQRRDAPAPEALADDLPADLAALCRDLLDRRPESRPSGLTILDRLRGRVPSPDPAAGTNRSTKIVGRERHLEILRSLYQSMKSGRLETVFLHGPPGTGKTAVLQAFLNDLEDRGEGFVLAGRCHERESVPFKAIDSMIDVLARRLKALPPRILRTLVPLDAPHLAQIFPVLQGVEGVAAPAASVAEPADPQEGRLRAFTALREMLVRLGATGPLVLAIDDVQWGDADSAVLLSDLLYSPAPPVLLFIASFREAEAQRGRFLQILRQIQKRVGSAVSHHDLALEPMPTAEARELAMTLLGRDDPQTRAQAHLVVQESAGNPLLISELVEHIQADRPAAAGDWNQGRFDLEDVVTARIKTLPDEAGRMLEAAAVAGRPINESLLDRVGGFSPSTRVGLTALRSARLVRCQCLSACESFEVYHDRIREAVLKRLSPEALASWHARLAYAYEAEPGADPEIVAGHFKGAGQSSRARTYYELAAARAASAFAFDHAARLYRNALEGADAANPAEKRRMLTRLGEALANSGRGDESAAAYLEAAESATAAEGLDLKRLASSQLLISGRIDEGTRLLRTILGPLRLSLPVSPRLAPLLLAWQRTRLRFRGLRFQPRAESEIPAEALSRIDVCWSVAVGLGVVDPIPSAYFQARGLMLALQAGEPYRIARALAMRAANEARVGRSASAEVERLTSVAESLADRADSPHARGIVAMARGSSALLMGDWKRSKDAFQHAETQFRNRCIGAIWELNTVHTLSLWAMLSLGELAEVSARYKEWQREARDRGDLHAASTLATMFKTFVRLAADASDEDGGSSLPPNRPSGRSSVQLLATVRSQVECGLYQQRVDDAWAVVEAAWTGFSRSPLSRIQMARIQVTELRGRAALAAAERSATPRPYLRIVEEHVRRLEREPPCWYQGYARHLRAGLAVSRNDAAGALRELGEAARAFEKYDMLLHACVMRLRAAEIQGGEQGRTQAGAMLEHVRSFGVAAPESWARMIAPGFARFASEAPDVDV